MKIEFNCNCVIRTEEQINYYNIRHIREIFPSQNFVMYYFNYCRFYYFFM